MAKSAEHTMSHKGTVVRTYTASEARNNFADLFDEAFYKGPVVIKKSSKRVAVISMDLLTALTDPESQEDATRAREALREFLAEGGKRWTDLKRELEAD